MASLVAIKVIAVFVLLIEGLVGGLLPVGVKSLRRPGRVLIAAQGFSGGVMFAIAVLDLLSDALEKQEEALGKGRYPYWSLFTLAGFLLVLLTEKVFIFSDNKPDVARQCQRKWGRLTSLRTSLAAAFALSLHSLLEGLAIGIQSDVAVATDLFIAVASHKLVAALALGVKVAKDGDPVSVISVTLVFAVMTPLGTLIGLGLTRVDPSLTLVLQCLATGTFLYVGASEAVHLGASHHFSSHSSASTSAYAVEEERGHLPSSAQSHASIENGESESEPDVHVGRPEPMHTSVLPYASFALGAVVISLAQLVHVV